jgi:hypothetical protein
MSMDPSKTGDADALEGHFFHTFTEEADGCTLVAHQGRILKRVADDFYLVELYEWFAGSPGYRRLARLDEMREWRLYDSSEWMSNAYEIEFARRTDAHLRHKEQEG